MNSKIVGDPVVFAIEYELEDRSPPYGRLRFWIDGLWLGDIKRTMFLYHVATSMLAMVFPTPMVTRIYSETAGVPSDIGTVGGETHSLGDAFDDFIFAIYAVVSEDRVYFRWALDESRIRDFPDYPSGPHKASVPWPVFNDVVKEFCSDLGIE